MQMKKNDLGTFEVVSGSLFLSDPCYDIITWCTGKLDRASIGTWRALSFTKKVDSWGERVWELEVFKEGSSHEALTWTKLNCEIGVDSGQAGIFDLAHFQDSSVITDKTPLADYIREEDEKWYSMCCAVSHSEKVPSKHAGVIPYGVNSSSGYGDGDYSAYAKTDAVGNVVAVKIVFIGEDEEEEDN